MAYVRVSTQGQDFTQQREYLNLLGFTRIFEEQVSGVKQNRPELTRLSVR